MYTPSAFREDRLEILHQVIRQYSFGTLVSSDAVDLVASHLPILLDPGRGPLGTLIGHMARPNAQWRAFASREVLAIFQGPHAYVSPSWYETALSVPTWNYVAVHAYGTPRVIEDQDEARQLIEATVRAYETGDHAWSIDRLSEEFVSRLVEGIVGFEIPIARIEGKFKLNQNRSPEDREGVIGALARSHHDNDRAVAELMRRL